MKSYYEILMQLEVFHDYFPVEEDHLCTILKFSPSGDCIQKLRQFRMIFKNTVNGFVLVGEKRNLGTDALPILVPVVGIPEGTKFNFLITETDNDFINITDTDPKLFSDGKKYVFRNNDAHIAVVNGDIATINIHNNDPVDDVLTLAPRQFIAPVLIADNPDKIVLMGVDGEYITEKPVPRDSFGNISTEHLVLSDTPFAEGIYVLQQVDATNTVVSEKKYFLFDPQPGVRVNGIVQFHYNNVFRAQADHEIHVTIQLSSRQIHWTYHVDIEKYEDPSEFTMRIKPADLQLVSTASNPPVGTPFTKTILQVSANPANWFINDKVSFRSNNPIPLKKKSYENLQLQNTTAAQPIIINHMPNPSPLRIQETLPNIYEADMFLKVK